MRSSRTSQGSRRRTVALMVSMLTAGILFAVAPPASAEHPSVVGVPYPRYLGEKKAVVTALGTECWTGDIGYWPTGQPFYYWREIDCDEMIGNEVEDAAMGVAVGAAAGLYGTWGVFGGSRVERFESGRIATGVDVFSALNGQLTAIPAGSLAQLHELWVQDSTGWRTCRPSTGWRYSSSTTSRMTPTLNWGTAPCGRSRYYAVWGGAAQHTDVDTWNYAWAWSGAVYVPALAAAAHRGAEVPSPLELRPLPRTGTKTTHGGPENTN